MFFVRLILAACIATSMTATSLFAHPGHGTTAPESVIHHVAEPVHSWWIVVGLVVVAIGYAIRQSQSRLKKARVRRHD